MTERPTRPLPPAVDPWAGQDDTAVNIVGMSGIPTRPEPAPPAPTGVLPGPQIVYVERPRRRRWPWVLGVLGVLGLACCGAAAVLTEPIRAQYPVHTEIHGRVAGFVVDADPKVRAEAVKIVAKIKAEQGADGAFAAKLDDPRDPKRPVVVFGATRLVWDPAAEMKKAIGGLGDGQVTGVTAYPVRVRDAQLRCADTHDDQGVAVVVCAWFDHGSVGVGLFYGGRTKDDSAAALREIRAAILVKD
ncbi:hypothetical protein Cs7R123_58000 [Catellatospora sp. TT07R-123]|uniref:hypothetical protein n=1 Tax=Catellatospora sp. TT07R-123 TaxID=2733863 RepID=UPI001B04F9D2|nr:hypothetical protein [Catellatospora sp. TT07R-123]GHJ48458.1 hypothetical protein Cs7R123_58000 [Catellatospora sp. TT07R-123]